MKQLEGSSMAVRAPHIQLHSGISAAAIALILSGCAISDMRQDDNKRLVELSHGQDALDSFSQLDGQAHMAKGKALLAQAGGSLHDLYFARSAFERAAILQVDDPTPYYLAGYTNYRLGSYDAAYLSFIGAALLEDTADGWWLAALAALRSRHELLAQALYGKGNKSSPGRSQSLASYMRTLYAPDVSTKVVARANSDFATPQFSCDSPDAEIDGQPGICRSELQAELFIVQRQAESGSSIGQDLMAGLSIGVSGSASTTRSSGSDIDSDRSITVDLASIDYALSIASDAEAVNTTSSTSVLKVALDHDAKLFVGQNLNIVGSGATELSVDEDIGITIELSLQDFSGTAATIKAAAEVSDYVPPVLGQTFTKVEIDSSSIESGGLVPYNSAFLLGSLEMTRRDDARGGQKGLRQIPVVGNLFGSQATSVATHEVAILLTIRPPKEIEKSQEIIFLNDLKELGVDLPTVAKRSANVHKSPQLETVAAEIGFIP